MDASVTVIATLIVAGSVLWSGVLTSSGARHIDTRYFYAAARCWAAGTSPYEPAVYEAMFRSIFGAAPEALFVAYLPTLMLVVLPMAPFDWPHAALLFALLNFAAAMTLYWACYRLVRESLGAPLRPQHWFWVALGATIGGVAGTVLTGQTSVFVTAGCALALVGCRLRRDWLTVIGIVIATAKPHLSGPLLLFIAVFEPSQRKAVAIALAIIAVVFGYAAAVDSHLLQSYLDSMKVYTALAVNDPANLTGLPALLLRGGLERRPAELAGMVALGALMAGLAWWLWRSRLPLTRQPLAVMLIVLSTGLGRSIQGYDLCAYAVALGLIATTPVRVQVALLVPALLLWRPGLALIGGHLPMGPNVVASIVWLVLLVAIVALALRRTESLEPTS